MQRELTSWHIMFGDGILEQRPKQRGAFCIGVGTEHEIVPGTIYSLNEHDAHDLVASDDEDLRLVCMFTPALTGDEAHRLTESGIHSSVY